MDSGLSAQDKKDLDKFIKFFALKVRSLRVAAVWLHKTWTGCPRSCLPLHLSHIYLHNYSCSYSCLALGFTFILYFLCADRPGDCPGSSWREDLHSLVFLAHGLWLGKNSFSSPFWPQTPPPETERTEAIFSCVESFYFCLPQFNLAIKDIPEVTHEAKKALAGQLPGIGRSMCVEISLKTSEVNTNSFSFELTLSSGISRTSHSVRKQPILYLHLTWINCGCLCLFPLAGGLHGAGDLVPGDEWEVSGGKACRYEVRAPILAADIKWFKL